MRNNISEKTTAIHNPLSKTQSRNYGIDLLKITAMFFIVCIHLGGHGKAFPETWFGALQHSIFATGVNCFALTSGYILVDREYKLHRILVYWLQVVLYSSLIMVYFYIYYPGSISQTEILFFLRPVYTDRYWYFSAYCIMYLFIPAYNTLLNNLSKTQAYTFIATLVVIFSVLNLGVAEKYFALSGGFSVWWLSILYFIGAVIKKYMNISECKVTVLLIVFLLSVILT
ncbi:MAG: acyltransferase family protein, partial [Clostridia bacterium]|nr:acyltransferase family protein [Clostridia bacterium]